MKLRLLCSYCDGYGYVEVSDPELVEKCRVCNGTGYDADTHEKMLSILLRRTYADYADCDPIWRMPSSRTLKLLQDGVPLTAEQYEWHTIRRDPNTGMPVCTCPVYTYSVHRQCKHTLFPLWLSHFQTASNTYEVPQISPKLGCWGHLRVYFEASHHAPVWYYRVYIDPRTYLVGCMPAWLYMQANRVRPSRLHHHWLLAPKSAEKQVHVEEV